MARQFTMTIQRDPKLFFKKFETKKIDHVSRLREHLAVNRAPHAAAAPAAPVTPLEPAAAVPARAILLHTDHAALDAPGA